MTTANHFPFKHFDKPHFQSRHFPPPTQVVVDVLANPTGTDLKVKRSQKLNIEYVFGQVRPETVGLPPKKEDVVVEVGDKTIVLSPRVRTPTSDEVRAIQVPHRLTIEEATKQARRIQLREQELIDQWAIDMLRMDKEDELVFVLLYTNNL